MTTVDNPVQVIDADDWHAVSLACQAEKCVKRPLIVTSRGTERRLKLSKVFESPIIKYASANPTVDQLQLLIESCRTEEFDGVIAIGGGSVMDTAKVAIAAVSTKRYRVRELFEIRDAFPRSVPRIFIPTTHGSGSEVTPWATVWDPVNHRKLSLSNESLYPDVAILDGNLTTTLPMETSLVTSLDALSHSFEAIWNKHRNSVSTRYAIEAIVLILKNLPRLQEDLTSLSVRQDLLRACNLAGLAFSRTRTAAAHAISYPLTINFEIPHGLAAFMSIIPLLEINKERIHRELSTLCDVLRINRMNELREAIANLPKPFLKTRLSDWGIKSGDLAKIVDEAFTPGRMENNIVPLARNDVLSILRQIF